MARKTEKKPGKWTDEAVFWWRIMPHREGVMMVQCNNAGHQRKLVLFLDLVMDEAQAQFKELSKVADRMEVGTRLVERNGKWIPCPEETESN